MAGPDAEGRHDGITVELHRGVMMEFVWIEPGTFKMGSAIHDAQTADEALLHDVTISKGFYLGKYEITQAQWVAVMGTAPWTGKQHVVKGDDHAASYVSWTALEEFLLRMNDAAGEQLYRLPTEAEWEYACRAGTTTRWYFGDDVRSLPDHAWFIDNALKADREHAQPVGGKQPNPWGLYDMYGNVWEWVQDWYSPSYQPLLQMDPTGPAAGTERVMRGGGFVNHARNVRSAKRFHHQATLRFAALGARLVRTRN